MFVLAYLLYGSAEKHQSELTYSVLSMLTHLRRDPADIRLVLVCDAANRRPDLPVEEVVVPAALLREWQFDGQYNHAAKQHALRHLLQTFDAPTLLVDTDTWATAHPRELFARLGPGQAMAHCAERPLLELEGEAEDYRRLIERTGGEVAGYPISATTVMHNSGVIGIRPEDIAALDASLAVTKAIWDAVRVFTAEQLAWAVVMQSRLQLQTCADLVVHYWGGPRGYYRYQIDRLFPRPDRPGATIQVPVELPVLRDQPTGRKWITWQARLFRRMRRGDGAYAHAWLCARNATAEREDARLANVWAEHALGTLRYGVPVLPPQIRADFAAFAPGAVERLGWLYPDLQKSWLAFWDSTGPGR